MSVTFAVPLAAAIVAAAVAAVAQRWLRPQVATRMLTVTSAAAAVAWLEALVAVLVGALSAVTRIDRWLSWCPNLYLADHHVSWWAGAAAGVLLAAAVSALVRRGHRYIGDRRRLPRCGRDGVLVLDCAEPTAFAVPGRGGGIVVSRGMMEALDPAERDVLWAHERAHLRHRHHGYLMASELAAATLPPLRLMARQVRFGTERWADESSVSSSGDRCLVARAITKAALASTDHRHLHMAMASSAVPARVEALIAPRHQAWSNSIGTIVAVTLMVVTVGGSALQLHHLVTLIEHVCGGR